MTLAEDSEIPPNFVHSLDSTHLMMTATSFAATGATFAGVFRGTHVPLLHV